MKVVLSILVLFVLVFSVNGQIKTRMIEYQHGDVVLEGYLAYDALLKSQRPGVLLVHEWWGLNDYARERANQLAELGYITLALDMYGKGVQAKTAEEAQELAEQFYENRQLMRDRAAAGLELLKEQRRLDKGRVAAMGYCFGGTVALELARSGAELACVVSFHGGLNTPNPEDAKNIKGSVLVFHGADDPFVPLEEVIAFQEEMRQAKLDWHMVTYGNAVHAFSNSSLGFDTSGGAAYNYNADKRSWSWLTSFLQEVLK